MAKLTVTKIFTFDAAHRLPHHKGNCRNLHGHTYKLEVTVSGEVKKSGPATGMIIDFTMLKMYVQQKVLDLYDHRDLNICFENPTAEIMVEAIAASLLNLPEFKLEKVRLWETDTSYAEWQAEWGR
jgi:6-pyruvoyltetrahydropterin/6-carboxytetrahydropterin synthase